MPYVAPTYAEFIARFPIFNDDAKYPQGTIEALLVEATNTIDTSWREVDYQPALLYLTAHLLATDASEEGDAVEIGNTSTAIASESFGGMSISYASPSQGALSSSERYGNTSYGRRYLALLRANKPGVVVA